MSLAVALGWFFRHHLHIIVHDVPQMVPAIFAALVVLGLTLVAILWCESEVQRRRFLQRATRVTGLKSLQSPGPFVLMLRSFPDPLDWACTPLFRTSTGLRLAEDWTDAGFGDKPSRYMLILALAALSGMCLGDRVAGPVVGLAFALVLPLLPRSVVANRASSQRRRFGEQLPQALDSISSGLAAGLSFQQAVEFSLQELPDPVANAMAKLWRRMALGFPVEEALHSLLQERQEESLGLVIEGIILQRQFGGDQVRMLEEMSDLLRERVELEREVRAVTTQGRLSAYVVAGLVPVSAAMLLMFNPHYVDVLFETLAGQMLLILALLLLLVGWWIISRMMRMRY
jgi:tight adherence protein B